MKYSLVGMLQLDWDLLQEQTGSSNRIGEVKLEF